jgi:hypothetical protein
MRQIERNWEKLRRIAPSPSRYVAKTIWRPFLTDENWDAQVPNFQLNFSHPSSPPRDFENKRWPPQSPPALCWYILKIFWKPTNGLRLLLGSFCASKGIATFSDSCCQAYPSQLQESAFISRCFLELACYTCCFAHVQSAMLYTACTCQLLGQMLASESLTLNPKPSNCIEYGNLNRYKEELFLITLMLTIIVK